jgi:hypothetical protein
LSEAMVSVILRKKVHMNMCVNMSDNRYAAVWIYKYKSIVNGNEEFCFNFILMFKFVTYK